MLLYYFIFSLILKTEEIISCAASGFFISTIPEAPNFYCNTAIITGICEFRENLNKHNIHPLRWSMKKIIGKNIFIDDYLLLKDS